MIRKVPEPGLYLARFRYLFMYGFSLFKMSTQRVGILNYNPPASRVVTHCYTQKSPFRTIIEVSSHYLRKERWFYGKENEWFITHKMDV